MRDTIKGLDYFRNYIANGSILHKKRVKEISQKKVPKERIEIVKADMSKNQLYICIAKYSSGYPVVNLLEDYYSAVYLSYEGWKGKGSWKINDGEIDLNQYGISAYNQMLNMLSLGYLFNIPSEKFQTLVEIIDRDGIKDELFEFIISAKLSDRQPIESESYQRYFGIPEAYSRLRNIIDLPNKEEAAEQMDMYLKKDWYNIQKDTGVKDLHNSRHDIYYGYWSFEAAAVVKIMGLDDSSFIDNQYYPKDLVHPPMEEPKKKGFLGRLGL
ncbi:PoNe immunity protein domain-containing protein [Hyunsoonleella sp. 2307UL5-6]|uniref:PoNe immunity protein domain-containing protein n=1 Tax=Hyunsoonleella sp. 2307UL5-6 TaxID=3384768 RepID=UPI0039BD2370